MKNILFVLLFLPGTLFAQWNTIQYKAKYADSVDFRKQFKIGGVTITTNAVEFNLLDGLLSNYTELNKLVGIGTDTIATRAYARGYGGTGTLNSSDTASMLLHYIERKDTASMLTNYVERKDTSSMLTNYIERKDTANMLTNYIERKDTASRFAYYARLLSPTFKGTVSGITAAMTGAAATSHNQAQTTITNLSDSLLVRYTKTQANTAFLEPHDTTHLRTNVNTLIS